MSSANPAPDPTSATAGGPVMGVDHYENFPVASWLCPPAIRPSVQAIYGFARTADDLADEGDADAGERLARLARYRAALDRAACGDAATPEDWPAVFNPLAQAFRRDRLPAPLLHDLLDAFEQDVRYTRDARCYADEAELDDYCRRSANPVGRLMLHLAAVSDPASLAQSDDICTALQLINFWQDLSLDIPRGRHYLTDAACRRHGVPRDDLLALRDTPAVRALVASEVATARKRMLRGAALPARVPGRLGWELRLVVQGGLRILDHIAALGYATIQHRPTLRGRDAAVLLWRSLRM